MKDYTDKSYMAKLLKIISNFFYLSAFFVLITALCFACFSSVLSSLSREDFLIYLSNDTGYYKYAYNNYYYRFAALVLSGCALLIIGFVLKIVRLCKYGKG